MKAKEWLSAELLLFLSKAYMYVINQVHVLQFAIVFAKLVFSGLTLPLWLSDFQLFLRMQHIPHHLKHRENNSFTFQILIITPSKGLVTFLHHKDLGLWSMPLKSAYGIFWALIVYSLYFIYKGIIPSFMEQLSIRRS